MRRRASGDEGTLLPCSRCADLLHNYAMTRRMVLGEASACKRSPAAAWGGRVAAAAGEQRSQAALQGVCILCDERSLLFPSR